jgi:RNA polymerase sigma-70 factor (ECF subfamily)
MAPIPTDTQLHLDRAPTDQLLIRRVAVGDPDALVMLRARHEVTLYALAYSELRDPVDSEHVVAEAFLELARRAGGFAEARGSVLTWLRQFTRRRVHELRSLRVPK